MKTEMPSPLEPAPSSEVEIDPQEPQAPATAPHTVHQQALVVGAGLSGLAVARVLVDKGIDVRVVDAAIRPAEAWRRRHPQLRLNIHRAFAHLPHWSAPRTDGAFLSRDTVVEHLDAYAEALPAPIDYDTSIQSVEYTGGVWRLSSDRRTYTCNHVIFATGRDRVPYIPPWYRREMFGGELIHAAELGDVRRFNGKRVLVVGAGNSGSDVLNHLSRQDPAEVLVSVRHGPAVVPARVLGFPLHRAANLFAAMPLWMVDIAFRITQRLLLGDLQRHGLSSHAIGGGTRLVKEGVAFAIDDGFVAAVKSGRFKIVGGLVEFGMDRVILDDGTILHPDVVIAATGYQTGLEPLLGHLGVIDERGVPFKSMGEPHSVVTGLWFTGYRPMFQGYFHAACLAADRIADAIANEQVDEGKRSSNHLADWRMEALRNGAA